MSDLWKPSVKRTPEGWRAWIPPTLPEHYEGGAILAPYGESYWPTQPAACEFVVMVLGGLLSPIDRDTRYATTLSPMAGYGYRPLPTIPADATVMTLGEFRAFTGRLPDSTQIVVDRDGRSPLNIPALVLPETEEGTHGTFAVTLLTADTFDSRQA